MDKFVSDDRFSDLSPADRFLSSVRTEGVKFGGDVREPLNSSLREYGEMFFDDPFDGHGPADCSPREIGGVS